MGGLFRKRGSFLESLLLKRGSGEAGASKHKGPEMALMALFSRKCWPVIGPLSFLYKFSADLSYLQDKF